MVVEKTGETEEIFKRKQEEEKMNKKASDEEKEMQNKPDNMMDKVEEKKEEAKDKAEEMKEEVKETAAGKTTDDKEKSENNAKGESDADDDKNKGEIGDEEKNNEPMVKRDNKAESEEFHTADEKTQEHEEEKPKPSFDESKNKEYEVPKDSDKAIPADVEEENVRKNLAEQMKSENLVVATRAPGEDEDMVINEGCELEKLRSEQKIIYEGHAYKKMSYCFCFWVKRYFVLLNDGSLRYFRDVNGSSLDFLKTDNLRLVTKETFDDDKHPYQILMTINNSEKMMAFDAPDARDAWLTKLSESIKDRKPENQDQ